MDGADDEVNSDQASLYEYALYLKGQALLAKYQAQKKYQRPGWTRLTMELNRSLDFVWPTSSPYADEQKYPGFRDKIEERHRRMWGYPIKVNSIDEILSGEISFLYHDLATDNPWIGFLEIVSQHVV